jgi:xylulokinase
MKHFSSNEEHRIGLFYRLAMEGITYLLADSLESMKDACSNKGKVAEGENSKKKGGFNPKRLLVVGGGSKNELWRQMLADVLDLDLCFPLEAESAALGAAFQAGAAVAANECNQVGEDDVSVSVEDFVSKQQIDMEESVVKPTENEGVKQLYQEGLKRYREWSKFLCDSP